MDFILIIYLIAVFCFLVVVCMTCKFYFIERQEEENGYYQIT